MSFKLIYMKDGSDFIDPSTHELHIYEDWEEANWACDIYTDIVGPLVIARIPKCDIPPLMYEVFKHVKAPSPPIPPIPESLSEPS